MKVVLPVHHFLPRYNAGVEIYVQRLARWLQHHGHQVSIVCIERTDRQNTTVTAELDDYNGIPVWRLSLDMEYSNADFGASYHNELIANWFGHYLDKAQPDIVHLHSGYLITPSVLSEAQHREIATVVTLHDYWFLCPRTTLLRGDGSLCNGPPEDPRECAWCMRLSSRRYRYADTFSAGLVGALLKNLSLEAEGHALQARRDRLQAILAQTSAVVAPSRFVQQLVQAYVHPERLHLLELGLEPTLFDAAPADGTTRRLRIVYIGQIAPHKGVHVLVEAVRRLPVSGTPVELHVYGDLDVFADYTARLVHLRAGDERITLCGRFDNHRIGTILAEANLLVAPSLWHEIGPLTVKEAFAAGVPVIVSALGNMTSLVRDGIDGLHVTAGDVQALATQLQRLRNDPTLIQHLRQGIRPPATFEDEMQQLMQIYMQVTSTAAPAMTGAPASIPLVP